MWHIEHLEQFLTQQIHWILDLNTLLFSVLLLLLLLLPTFVQKKLNLNKEAEFLQYAIHFQL